MIISLERLSVKNAKLAINTIYNEFNVLPIHIDMLEPLNILMSQSSIPGVEVKLHEHKIPGDKLPQTKWGESVVKKYKELILKHIDEFGNSIFENYAASKSIVRKLSASSDPENFVMVISNSEILKETKEEKASSGCMKANGSNMYGFSFEPDFIFTEKNGVKSSTNTFVMNENTSEIEVSLVLKKLSSGTSVSSDNLDKLLSGELEGEEAVEENEQTPHPIEIEVDTETLNVSTDNSEAFSHLQNNLHQMQEQDEVQDARNLWTQQRANRIVEREVLRQAHQYADTIHDESSVSARWASLRAA